MSESALLTNGQITLSTTILTNLAPKPTGSTTGELNDTSSPTGASSTETTGSVSGPNLTVIIVAVSASLFTLAVILTITFKILQRRKRLKDGRRPSKIEEGGGDMEDRGLDASPGFHLGVDGNMRNSDIPLASPMPLLGVDHQSYSYRDSNNSNLSAGGYGVGWGGVHLATTGPLEDGDNKMHSPLQTRVVSMPLLVSSEQRRHMHSGSVGSMSLRSNGRPLGSKRRTCPEPLDLKPLSKPFQAQSQPEANPLDTKPLPKTPTASEIGTISDKAAESVVEVVLERCTLEICETNSVPSWRAGDDQQLQKIAIDENGRDAAAASNAQENEKIEPETGDEQFIVGDEPESPILGIAHRDTNIIKGPDTPRTPRRSVSEMRHAMNEHLERQGELIALTQKLNNQIS